MKIILPVQLNPISRRKDRSVRLSLETRELATDEIMALMSLEGLEMWMALAPNDSELPEMPKENAELEQKSMSKRQKSVIFLLWKQSTDKGKYAGNFESYYNAIMEKHLEKLKELLDD